MSYKQALIDQRKAESKVKDLEMQIALKMQRDIDRDKFLDILNQFPNYHGPGYNYTKEEIEVWLKKAHSLFDRGK